MSDLSRSRIDFDEVRVSGARLQHEVKSVKPGKIEPANHPSRPQPTFLRSRSGAPPWRVRLELALLTTSKCRLASTAPFQQTIALVASCPATNAWALTTGRRRRIDGQSSVLSWSTRARFTALASNGGACSSSKKRSASARVCAILTPSPPEVPFALRTVGSPCALRNFSGHRCC